MNATNSSAKKWLLPFSFNHLLIILALVSGAIIFFSWSAKKESTKEVERDPGMDYFASRNAHYGTVPQEVKDAIRARLELDDLQQQANDKMSAIPKWKGIGPSNIGGRITDIEMPKNNDTTIYAGSASGGIFKSTNYGKSWTPIFDKQSALAIGDIEIDPNDDNIMYVGTGEPNTGGGSITYDGNGIYKSSNAGKSWKSIGLTDVGTIGKVSVAKTNSQVIYVAAVGNVYQKSVNKGLYKSIDGGTTWSKVLYISDSTSVNDVAVSPVDANTLYATTWERISRPDVRVYGGITSNLYKSTDGGANWAKLLPDDPNRGKLTIDIPPTNANKLYISIANKDGTFNTLYRYDGVTFTHINSGISATTTYCWWFSGIKCHPTNENIVYFSDFSLFRTTNGGTSWQTVAPSSHVDQHSVFIHPANISKVVIGNDGGVYTSTNALSSITLCKIANTQIYDFDLYKADETFLSAAFQDNSFAHTSSQTLTGWQPFGGGDGVEVRVSPTDKTETYSSQYGGINITTNGINFSDRFNWRCPIRLDPVNPAIRYFGTNKLYKFNPSQNKWTAISGDLTNGSGTGNYGTITTIAVAPTNNNYIYTGSDDGQVYVTKNGGASWQKITTGLPAFWATFIKADRTNPEIAYIGFSGYRYGFKDAHIYKTTNAGATWTRISNDLPQVPVNDLEIDPLDSNELYLGTDIGVYSSSNGGTNWVTLGNKLPSTVVSTLNFAVNSRQLYAATYGRSMYKLDLSGTLPNNNLLALSHAVKSAGDILAQWANSSMNKDGLNAYGSAKVAENSPLNVSVYPNPARDYTMISLGQNKEGAVINVYNSIGQVVISERMEANVLEQRISLGKLPTGNYTVVSITNDNQRGNKLMVQR